MRARSAASLGVSVLLRAGFNGTLFSWLVFAAGSTVILAGSCLFLVVVTLIDTADPAAMDASNPPIKIKATAKGRLLSSVFNPGREPKS